LAIALYIKNKQYNLLKKPYYKYFIPALICKIIGAIGVCLVYSFYYKEGGDTVNYYLGAKTYINILLDGKFESFFNIISLPGGNIHQLISETNIYNELYFRNEDNYALFTVGLTVPFCLIGCKSFIVTTILLASVSFIGLWRLYEVFIYHFPHLTKQFAIAIFFVPSVFFWGSGLLKDTYTLSCVGFFTYGIFNYFVIKKKNIKYILTFIIASLIIVFIKPYILLALLPGTIIWINFSKVQNIKNPILKTLFIPFILTVGVLTIIIVFNFLGQYLGEYSLDNVLNKAVKTQQDLVRSQYGGNNYDIGAYEPTLAGIFSKIPAALNMALFRPYIWDARNPVMLLSGLENLFMLGFSLSILFKVKFSTLFKSLFSHPLLIFSFLFAIFFAFSVGLTTANYGALVRLKIPCIPFYLLSLFILFDLNKISFKRR
jgi:hypothetical protein